MDFAMAIGTRRVLAAAALGMLVLGICSGARAQDKAEAPAMKAMPVDIPKADTGVTFKSNARMGVKEGELQPLFAADNVTALSGVVVSTAGVPLPGVVVTLKEIQTTTDSQ